MTEATGGVWVGVLTFVVTTPGARSLKDKRGMITPIVERLRRRFPVSVARLSDLDRRDRERLGVVIVSADPEVCRQVLERALAFAESFGLRLEATRLDVDRWD